MANTKILPEDILSSLAVLTRGSESVRAVMAGEDNRFARALLDLQRLAEEEDIPIAIVGGLGAIRYGYPAATQDIDVVIGQSHLEMVIRTAPRYGFKAAWEAKSGWHTLTHGDVEIKVVPEGGKARLSAPTTIPGPPALGVPHGLGYAHLPGWVELKLSSGRQKDKAHIVEVFKVMDQKNLPDLRARIGQAHSSYLELLDALYQEAMAEKEQENQR